MAFEGKGSGMTEKVTAPLVGSVPLTVRLSVLPTLTTLSPIGSSCGPRETVKVDWAEVGLPARSETETDTVCWPGESSKQFKPFKQFKSRVKPLEVIIA